MPASCGSDKDHREEDAGIASRPLSVEPIDGHASAAHNLPLSPCADIEPNTLKSLIVPIKVEEQALPLSSVQQNFDNTDEVLSGSTVGENVAGDAEHYGPWQCEYSDQIPTLGRDGIGYPGRSTSDQEVRLPQEPASFQNTDHIHITSMDRSMLELARDNFQQSLTNRSHDETDMQSQNNEDEVLYGSSSDRSSPMVIDSDDEKQDEAGTAEFEKIKRAFRLKQKRGVAGFKDQVEFQRAKAAERQRQTLKAERKRAAEEVQLREDESEHSEKSEGLFVTDEDNAVNRPSKSPRASPIEPPKKRRKSKISQKSLAESMELGRGNTQRVAAKRAGKNQSRRGGTGCRGGRRSATTAKRGGGSNKKTARGSFRPQMANVDSLMRNDIIGDARANRDRDSQAIFSASNRKAALAELIASVPEDQRKPHGATKKALDEACRKFTSGGSRSVKPDGGKWRLKGMRNSLMHHQLLGASWMRERETSNTKPRGGLVADTMGFGKTIMCLANILDGRPPRESPDQTTLVVCPSPLCTQWLQEAQKHVEKGRLGRIMLYRSGSRVVTDDPVETLSGCGIIITTYHEVLRSYPRIEEPSELETQEARDQFYREQFEEKKGPLHRINFHRIVLDEATVIKNHCSKITVACLGLAGKYRWIVSGTPIHNKVEELYPYFKFAKFPFVNSFDEFKHHFCTRTEEATKRLLTYLRLGMLRRTLADEIFGRPIIKLPPVEQEIVYVSFNPIERAIYQIAKSRLIAKMNTWSRTGNLNGSSHSVFTLLLRLRQLCGHVLLVRDVMSNFLEAEDFEKLWKLTERGVNHDQEDVESRTLGALSHFFDTSSSISVENQGGGLPASEEVAHTTRETQSQSQVLEGRRPSWDKFLKFLMKLKDETPSDEVWARSHCHRCHQSPEEPHMTIPCQHIYCKECLSALLYDIRFTERQKALCLACQNEFDRSEPCDGQLGAGASQDHNSGRTKKGDGEKRKDDWLDLDGCVFPSAKTIAVQEQLRKWLSQEPSVKIVVFTQFLDLIRIVGHICRSEGLSYCEYKGSMSSEQRDRSVQNFHDQAELKVMLASLKCGGLGLNLTMANKVIILDPWWNEAVEDQAWSRVYRIGQEKDVDIKRFFVNGTVETNMLRSMQLRKNEEIESVMGPNSQPEKMKIETVMRLFGPVVTDPKTGNPVVIDQDDSGLIEEEYPRE